MSSSATLSAPSLHRIGRTVHQHAAFSGGGHGAGGQLGSSRLPMGSASMAYALWDRSLKFNPRDPIGGPGPIRLISRTRVCAAVCIAPCNRVRPANGGIKRFRQWAVARLGIRNMARLRALRLPLDLWAKASQRGWHAIAEVALAARFNRPGHRIVDHYTYVLVSDGDLERVFLPRLVLMRGTSIWANSSFLCRQPHNDRRQHGTHVSPKTV